MNKLHCGFAALIGRPNVGKSTLLNQILGKKISITSRKPQTTRKRILGIATHGNYQTVYVDTPGIHQKTPHALNVFMNKAAKSALHDVDVIIFMTEASHWTEEDDFVLRKLKKVKAPIIWVLNKVDKIKDKSELLPLIEKISASHTFAKILPISARRSKDVTLLNKTVEEFLPPADEFFYPTTVITDQQENQIAADYIREALLNALGDEVPHLLATVVEKIEHKSKIIVIHGVIYVQRESHKAIIIGKNGERLRGIGQEARLALEKYFQKKVFLELWVKVKSGWIDDSKAMRQLGYNEHG